MLLASLPRHEQQRVRAAIDLLATEPRPPGASKLAGEHRTYRVRVGAYRILYEVFDDRLLVQVMPESETPRPHQGEPLPVVTVRRS